MLSSKQLIALDRTAPTSFAGLPKCDADGNFYLSDADGLAISKFNSKGERIAGYPKASSSPDVAQVDTAGTFTVSADGDVHQLVLPHSYDRDVFLYNKDGSYKSKVALDAARAWSPSLFVAFPSGDFLATGQKWDRASKEYVPFTGIFSSDGPSVERSRTWKKTPHETHPPNSPLRATRVLCRGPFPARITFAISRGQLEDRAADGSVHLLCLGLIRRSSTRYHPEGEYPAENSRSTRGDLATQR